MVNSLVYSQRPTVILTDGKLIVLKSLIKSIDYATKMKGNNHSHSHFGLLKNWNPCFTPVLLVVLKIGAGEGNRTLVTGIVVLSGAKWPISLAFFIEMQGASCISCTQHHVIFISKT
jgi:hypothetical protein